jgi:hypothetical protein
MNSEGLGTKVVYANEPVERLIRYLRQKGIMRNNPGKYFANDNARVATRNDG